MNKKLAAGITAFAVATSIIISGSAAQATTATAIAGGGSTFAFNALNYCAAHYDPASGDSVTYSGVGSGSGRSGYVSGSYKWAASDGTFASSGETLPSGRYSMVPLVGGPIVFAYNKNSGIPANLKLDAATISKIFKGTVATWNAPAIKALNPGKTLPAKAIKVYYRTSGSGTTANLTNYLSQTLGSSEWVASSKNLLDAADGVSGNNNTTGLASTALAKSTSSVIADMLQTVKYSFGYFDLSDAVSASVSKVALKNKAGAFVSPTATAAATFLNAQTAISSSSPTDRVDGTLAIDFTKNVKGAYQLSVVTYGIGPKGASTEAARAVHDWFNYVVNTCMPAHAASLGYVALTGTLKNAANTQIAGIN